MFPRRPAHLRSFDYIGMHRYFLTWCCHDRQPLFLQEDTVELVRAQILRACDPTRMTVFAYCFMPDHVHLLVEGLEAATDGKRYFGLAKQYLGICVRAASIGRAVATLRV